jgi:hypothetical protein
VVARKTSARSGKDKTPTTDAADEPLVLESASELAETSRDVTADADADTASAQVGADASPVDAPTFEDQVVEPDEPVSDTNAPTGETEDTVPDAEETPNETKVRPPEPEKVIERVVERRGSALPLVFAGVVTAALGFIAGAGDLLAPVLGTGQNSEVTAQVTQLDSRIGGVEAALKEVDDRVAAISQPDLSPVIARIEAAETALANLGQAQSDIGTQIADMGVRVSELATRPLTEGASDAAIAAFEAELAGLQSSIAEQRAQVEQMVAEARAMEADAAEQARRAEIQSALARVVTALDSGDSLAAELAALAGLGVDVPQGLSAAAEGAPTLASLQEGFAPAARAALAVARSGGEGGDAGVTGWLQKQLAARSVTPRDGADPDAVLSRAGAAVSEGRLGDALAELDTLSDGAKAEMASWVQAAQTRQAATDAADALAAQLAAN